MEAQKRNADELSPRKEPAKPSPKARLNPMAEMKASFLKSQLAKRSTSIDLQRPSNSTTSSNTNQANVIRSERPDPVAEIKASFLKSQLAKSKNIPAIVIQELSNGDAPSTTDQVNVTRDEPPNPMTDIEATNPNGTGSSI